MEIDGSVYPDLDSPPRSLDTPEAKADYLHRVCTAWDYGVPPADDTVGLFSGWQEIFDRFPCVTSPAYHALRQWFRWPPVAVPPGLHHAAPRYREYDRLEGRREDPCEAWI
jgi:hypothetical protein